MRTLDFRGGFSGKGVRLNAGILVWWAGLAKERRRLSLIRSGKTPRAPSPEPKP